jgi:hypothetical protein
MAIAGSEEWENAPNSICLRWEFGSKAIALIVASKKQFGLRTSTELGIVMDLIAQPRKQELWMRAQEEPFSNVIVASPASDGQRPPRVARFRTLILLGIETASSPDQPRSRPRIDKGASPSNISPRTLETGAREPSMSR